MVKNLKIVATALEQLASSPETLRIHPVRVGQQVQGTWSAVGKVEWIFRNRLSMNTRYYRTFKNNICTLYCECFCFVCVLCALCVCARCAVCDKNETVVLYVYRGYPHVAIPNFV